jgi:hypothetical protein
MLIIAIAKIVVFIPINNIIAIPRKFIIIAFI